MDRLFYLSQTHSVDQHNEEDPMMFPLLPVLEIIRAEYRSEYRIHLWFNDRREQTVDFGPFLQASQHPEIRKYLDIQKFKNFSIIYGDLVWNDYDLCFPIADLYEAKVSW